MSNILSKELLRLSEAARLIKSPEATLAESILNKIATLDSRKLRILEVELEELINRDNI